MSEFWIYFQTAWRYVLDVKSYHHVLFLMALTVPYGFRDLQRLALLVIIFVIGQILAMLLSFFGIVVLKTNLNEFLIPITILITSLFNLFSAGKLYKGNGINIMAFVVFFFGIIHGLEFSNYFKLVVSGDLSLRIARLFEFILGIQAAQITIVLMVLIFSYIVQSFLKFSKRDFILTFSAFLIGLVLPLIIESVIWK